MTSILPQRLIRTLLSAALPIVAGAVQAQSLQCTQGSVGEGDAKVWLLRACGQPSIADSYCARAYTPPQPRWNPYGGVQQVPQAVCVTTDEWLYDRGEGNLIAFVRIREGKVVSIRFGEQGRSQPR